MARSDLSGTQRFFLRMVDAETAEAMKAHSRAWLLECPNCGFTRSVWELGGIRYKASGDQRNRLRCPRCGETGWHRMKKADNFPATDAPALPLVRMIVLLTLAILLLVGVVLLLVFWLTGLI